MLRARSEWRSDLCTRYHSYISPENNDLLDTKAFVSGDSTAFVLEKTAVFLDVFKKVQTSSRVTLVEILCWEAGVKRGRNAK